MINFWRSAIRQQFHAAIDMLGNAIEACPDSVWSAQAPRAFWYLAFHTIFFLDLYLSECEESRFHPPPPFGLTELEDEVIPQGARLRTGRTARLPRALPQTVGDRDGGNDRSLGYVSQDEQR